MNILDNVKGELIPYDDPILTSPQEDWKFDEYPQEEAAPGMKTLQKMARTTRL